MFGINNSRDFLAKLEAEFADYANDPGSARLALNCAMTAYHIHEWVWGDWLKKDKKTQKELGFKDIEGFRSCLFDNCIWLAWMQEFSVGTKHFAPPSFQALQVGGLPLVLDSPGLGLDVGHLDGPQPYTTGDEIFLLIDNGPDADPAHRFMPFSMLLNAVIGFWRWFFETYAPPSPAPASS